MCPRVDSDSALFERRDVLKMGVAAGFGAIASRIFASEKTSRGAFRKLLWIQMEQ